MRLKHGVSMIVLAVTIVVMAILASTAIIYLDDTSIIGKSKNAVKDTKLIQVTELAKTAWNKANAKLEPTLLELEKAVNDALTLNNIDTEEYNIIVTLDGVYVSKDFETPIITSSAMEYTNNTATVNLNIGRVDTYDYPLLVEYYIKPASITKEEAYSLKQQVMMKSGKQIGYTYTALKQGTAYNIKVLVRDVNGNAVSTPLNVTTSGVAEVEKATLGSLITAENYGDTINYVSDNGVTDWKIFYHTEDYVYLIASEKLAYDKIPTKLKETVDDGGAGATTISATVTLSNGATRTVGQIYWDPAPTTATTIKNPTKWMANWGDYSTNDNGKCASYFLDETYWTGFKNTTESYAAYVEGAIGTPTVEMFVASYNEKRLTETNTSKIKITLSKNGTNGYYVNGDTALYIGTSDPLYIWTTASNSSTWLASPSAYSTSSLLRVSTSGYLNNNRSYNPNHGVRPVVCLKYNTPAEIGTTTDFEI